jgi:hypothetical protein
MYGVRVIRDDQLPEEFDWALVECSDTGNELFLVKESAACCPDAMAAVMAEGWAAYRKLDRAHTPCRQGSGDGLVSFLPVPQLSSVELQRLAGR